MGGIVDAVFGGGGDDAADAAEKGAELQAAGQKEALDYLKQTERLPQAYREQALSQLGMLYGLPGLGGTVPYGGYAGQSQQQAQPQMIANPAYTSYMSNFNAPAGTNSSGYLSGDSQLVLDPREIMQNIGATGGGLGAPPQMIPNPAYSQQDQQGMQGEGYSPLDKAAFVEALRQDPFYESMLQQGEQAVLRGASATGGLRSGTASENLARNSQNVLHGYYNQQVQGLTGLAGTPSNANTIASQMAGIGQTLGQGQIAAGQAQQAGQQQQTGNLFGLASLGLGAYGAGMFGGGAAAATPMYGYGGYQGLGIGNPSSYSDRKLKGNIRKVDVRNGHNWYKWTWNDKAEEIGLSGECEGVIADEIKETNPEAVGEANGYLTVNYHTLGV